MNIAVCDNDIECIERILHLLQPYMASEELSVDTYISGEKFLENMNEAMKYDIIFLDIEMAEVSGIDVARILREHDSKVIIIFTTGYLNYVSDTFRLGAFQFLVKPIDEQAFRYDFERALRTYRNHHRFYQVMWRDTSSIIEYGDILYIEGYQRHIHIYTSEREYECVGKIAEVSDKLRQYNFIRCHQGFIVNLTKIKEISRNNIILINDTVIPVSRRYRTDLMNSFNLFLAGKLI